jgi:dipeptidyl aminopeptidase/acylaminoacyl peptidase
MVFGALVAGTALSQASAAEPLSAEKLLESPTLLDIDLSPDGNTLAAVVRVGEGEGIQYGLLTFPATLEGQPKAIGINGGDVKLTPIWVTWASDDRLLVSVVTEFRATQTRVYWPSARLIAYDVDGGNPVLLFENERGVLRGSTNLARITDMLPDDPDHVLMPGRKGGDLDLWKVNIRTGDAEVVARGTENTFAWYTDTNGTPMIRLDANRSGSVISAFAPPEEGDGRWRRVARVREEDQSEFQPLAAAEEAGAFYTSARPDGADRAGIYIYDAATNTFVREVASDPRVDVEGVLVNGRTGAFEGYYYVDDRLEYRFEDELLQRHFDAVREFLGADVNARIYDMSEDGRRWIIQAQGPQEPGAYYLYDVDATRMEILFAIAEETPRDSFAPMQVVRYPTRDGREITGYLSLPPDRAPEKLPLVMMPHGGPELRDMMSYDVWVQYLASRGYAVFQPNFRGSSGYGRAFADAGKQQWGAAMQDDLTDGVSHLAGMGVIDPNRVCIFGASYGGYAALAGAAFTPDLYKCAISMSGISDLRDFMRHVSRDEPFDDEDLEYWVKQIGDPRVDEERLRQYSPQEHAAEIRVPVLLIHGSEDWMVPPGQSRDMARALEDAGVPHSYVEIEGVGHSGWPDEEEIRALDQIAAFLAENLPAD